LEAMSAKPIEKYYAVEDQRFVGEEEYGEEISRVRAKPDGFFRL
jgi:hypothetical protein